jgi:KDO2-lipid IV(A) lauroyltransferase
MPEPTRKVRALRTGLRAATAAIRVLGPLRYPLAEGIGMVAYAVEPARRRRTAANHRRRDPSLSESEARRLARQSYRGYAMVNVDFIWANAMDLDEVVRQTRLEGAERAYAALDEGRGAILTLSHYGSWDMAALIAQSRDVAITTVMAPIGNSMMTDLVIWARQRNLMEVFTPERAARGLIRALGRRRCVAILADIPEQGPHAVVQYCGGPVEFSTVPAWLASRTGAHILPAVCRRGGRGEPPYVASILERVPCGPDDDATEVMQRVAASLEAAIRQDPSQWYPFSEVYADAR